MFLFYSCSDDESYEGFKQGRESIIRFQIDVDTVHFSTAVNSTVVPDWAVLILPKSYSSDKKPTQLVIYSHSGGGTVTSSFSEAEDSDFVKYLVSQGIAVLSVAGIPESLSARLQIDHFRTVGSPIALKSIEKAYEYVITNYNISADGAFLLSNSNGGLLAGNIINLSSIPILSYVGIAPLISIEFNAWNIRSGSLSGGGFSEYQIRANIIRLYKMNDIQSLEELCAAVYEKDRVNCYDPYDYNMFQSDLSYQVPTLIFSYKNDHLIDYNLIRKFADEMNKRGSNIDVITEFDFGAHNVVIQPTYIGSFNYMNKQYQLKQTVSIGYNFLMSNNNLYK